MLYLILKTIHILAVTTALGTNLTYGFLMNRAERQPDQILYMLNTIRWLDRTLANRSYLVVLLTGLAMIWRNGYGWNETWLWLSLILFILIALSGIFFYAPIIKKQVSMLEKNRTATSEYKKIHRLSKILGLLITLISVGILVMMVVKPA